MKKDRSVFVYGKQQLDYKFSDTHPFNPVRLQMTYELLESLQAFSDEDVISPQQASEEDITLFHDPAYVKAVKKAAVGDLSSSSAAGHGLGTEDTPIFAGMHEASAQLVGGTLQAVKEVMEGRADHATNMGGGLHHGFRGKASGFCIYNDSAIAIRYIRKKYDARVLYIDTDAHHGDGVQWAFYDDPNVMTVSIHETGRYLFPGTGAITEKGTGEGYGYSLNIPLDAFTEDDSFLSCYHTAVSHACQFFKPDVILTQNGADAHYLDPLTHLASSLRTFREIPRIAHEVAHEYCDGRWIAVGGGGYEVWRVVPFAWSFVWLEMNELSHLSYGKLPVSWYEKWAPKTNVPLPTHWEEASDLIPTIPRKLEIEEKNFHTLEKALYYIQREMSTSLN